MKYIAEVAIEVPRALTTQEQTLLAQLMTDAMRGFPPVFVISATVREVVS